MKKIFIITIAIISLISVACQKQENLPNQNNGNAKKEIELSNMSNAKSIEEVSTVLKSVIDIQNVQKFIDGVKDYNKTVENTGLIGDFEKTVQPEYDVVKISELWTGKKGEFIGTNCRINSFILLKDNLEIQKSDIDDSLLFLDIDSVNTGGIFSERDFEKFRQFFSKVKTEPTKDVKIHSEKMEKHFSNIKFDEKARMVCVVLHDNLEGDYLFVGHVGVLVKSEKGLLFVEKLSFEEPFQAVKFDSEEECYNYLFEKYKHYNDETTAKPFIMDNGKFVELDAYK